MTNRAKILFISQEIIPYMPETSRARMGKWLPQVAQEAFDTRTFMPRWGEINERRNLLHEVIRLSGQNIIIDDNDHPLLIKVATIAAARIQIYFIDNEEYFHRMPALTDERGAEYKDNDERTIFYVRGALETVRKLRWAPDIIVCSGWMSALAPLYIKKAYADDPFFKEAKIVTALTDDDYHTSFKDNFAQKALIPDVTIEDFGECAQKPVTHERLMKLAIDHSDALMITSSDVSRAVYLYANKKGIPLLDLQDDGEKQAYLDFYDSLLKG